MHEKLEIKRMTQDELVEYDKIHCEENRGFVGEFDFSGVIEEAVLPGADIKIKGHGKCKFYVYGNEGKYVPHFHIESNDGSFSCCIRLDKPEYFIHGHHNDTLSNSEIKELIKVLNSYRSKTYKITYYEFACMLWCDNENNTLEEPYIMPDYSKLNK